MSHTTARSDFVRRHGFVVFLCALLPLVLSTLACVLPSGATPTPTPTNTPVPPPPPPTVAGVYYGYFTTYGSSAHPPMGIQITQAGGSLAGASYEEGAVSSNSGSIASDGVFTITETFSNGMAYLHGSPAGAGHLSGTWDTGGSALGTWDVYASIAGGYSGSYTQYASSGSSPMSMQITQSNSSLGGSTNESGSVSSNSGSFTAGGSFTIQENFSGGLAYLHGTIVGPGQLSGTWDLGGAARGTWTVTRV